LGIQKLITIRELLLLKSRRKIVFTDIYSIRKYFQSLETSEIVTRESINCEFISSDRIWHRGTMKLEYTGENSNSVVLVCSL